MPDLSVVISTFNRAGTLRNALESASSQMTEGVQYEVIVVDNNSTDDTRAVVEDFAGSTGGLIRYAFEPKQGLSHGRNKGIAESTASIVAFTDDDVRVAPDWVHSLYRAFLENPDAWFVGGKVLPLWAKTPDRWLTGDMAPTGLQDHGNERKISNLQNRMMMIGANCAFRRKVFDKVGLFSPELQRVKDGIGSMEDQEFLTRIWKAGSWGVYDPRIQVHGEVTLERMTKAYHRRWHRGFGHYNAIYRDDVFETDGVRFFDVPGHFYRQAVGDVFACAWLRLRGDEPAAFRREGRLRFFQGYYSKRRADYIALNGNRPIRELLSLARTLLRRGSLSHGSGSANA